MLGPEAVPANDSGATYRATDGPVGVSESPRPQKPV